MTLNTALTNVTSGATISSATENANLAAIQGASPLDLTVNDSNIGSTRVIHVYIGTVDPTTRAGVTVVEGDLWLKV
jgi:hypothetical protein